MEARLGGTPRSILDALSRALPPAPRRETWPLVSIVVPTLDRVDRLRRLLEGLADRTDYPRFELVVTDNASSDGTVDWLRRAPLPFPVSIVVNARNLSFSAACNVGASRARGTLLLFLNNDVDPIEPTWLRRLVSSLETGRADVAGAVLVDPVRTSRSGRTGAVQHAGLRFVDPEDSLAPALVDLDEDVERAIGPDTETAAVAAACALVRRGTFDAVGGFCELYRYGAEDIDLCLRVRAGGGRVLVSRTTVLLHGPDSTRRRQPHAAARELREANRTVMRELWGPGLRREHALDARRGDGVWSAAPDPGAVADVVFCVRPGTAGADEQARDLADRLRRAGRAAAPEAETDWRLADVLLHVHDVPIRDVLLPGRCNVLVRGPGESAPSPIDADRYDLVADAGEPAERLAERAEAFVAAAGGPSRIQPVPPRRPGAVVILGMSRSGTSVAARILNLLGVELGDEERLLAADPRVNARGFYEHYEIMRLNTQLLKRLGGSWRDPPRLGTAWWTDPRLDDLREQAASIIERDFAHAETWGFKDPRTSLTLPFWRPLLPPDAAFVVCHRNPLDIAASLARRDGLTSPESISLWMRCASAAVTNSSDGTRTFIGYEEHFDERRSAATAALATIAGRPGAERDPDVVAAVDAWVTSELRHHRSPSSAAIEDAAMSADARELHLGFEVAASRLPGADGPVDATARRLRADAPSETPAAPPGGEGTLAERVARFGGWHYDLDLGAGVRTAPGSPTTARHRQRHSHIFGTLLERVGGSLAGRRVLDLGCNAGFWSLAAIEAGCDFVLGLDGRAMHVEQARLVFEARDVAPSRYAFRQADVLEADLDREAPFDLVLCLGLLYHVADPVGLFERMSRWSSDLLVVDTTLSTREGSAFDLVREATQDARNSVRSDAVLVPTLQAVVDLATAHGFAAEVLEPAFTDWTRADDYRSGRRRVVLAARSTPLGDPAPAARRPRAGRRAVQALGPPLVVGGTGGSGTRVVKRMVDCAGLHLGSRLNGSQHDALELAEFDTRWGPQWARDGASEAMRAAFEEAVERHLAELPPSAPGWGWKHPQSYLLLPFLAERFPGLRFVHVIRDGRDVATSDNRNQLELYGDAVLGDDAADGDRALDFWAVANTRAADFGEAALGERYLRVRLEDLCADPGAGARQLLRLAGGRHDSAAVAAAVQLVDTPATLGRWRSVADAPAPSQRARAALERFGYL